VKILSYLLALLLTTAAPAFATVTVTSPASGATINSPVQYVATATTSTCAKGVASMGIYVNSKLTYVVNGASLNTSLTLNPGPYNTVVEEWDKCGGASYTAVPITVANQSTQTAVTVTSPVANSTVSSPVNYVASATTGTCAKGVASMGIYVNNKIVYTVNAPQLNTLVNLAPGPEHTVVQEWDFCGGSAFTTINLTVQGGTTVSMTATPASITYGDSSTLSVTATNAGQVTISGTDGSSYNLPANGGTQVVSPGSTTTYTATATGASGSVTATATVSVVPAGSTQSINHVIFMLQENHSFDNYFGMLNPYRQSHGFEIGDDGVKYDVDGIEDKVNGQAYDSVGKAGQIISNNDQQNPKGAHTLFKFKSTCVDDMSSAWTESYADTALGNFSATRQIRMNGFASNADGFANSKCPGGVGPCTGFTDVSGDRAMGYYDEGFLNYYYYMASQFGLSDRWFSPVSSKSIPNRIATFTGGTTQGITQDPGSDDHFPQLNITTIFNELDQAGVSWKIYYTAVNGQCDPSTCHPSGALAMPSTTFSDLTYSFKYLYLTSPCTGKTQPSSVVGDTTNSFCIDPTHIAPLNDPRYGYFADLKNGTLPSFTFIESGSGFNDEHPGSGQSVLAGQKQVSGIINALMTSSSWKDSAFFFAYDEGGGPYEHVPPVPGHTNDWTDISAAANYPTDISSIAVNADSYKPCAPTTPPGTAPPYCDLKAGAPGRNSTDDPAVKGFAAQLGFRVPNMVVSPFVRKHYVSHIPMDHTAVIKFVENRFIGSSAHLTARDAAQPNLLDFFDFNNAPWATPPTPPSPVTNGSLGFNPCTPTNLGP
jgi:phospholipase C